MDSFTKPSSITSDSIDISLRPVTDADQEFLIGVYANSRAAELAQVDWDDSQKDAFIRWQHHDLGVQAGQFKTPFTREFVTSLADLETADRSTVVDSLAPKRDLGLMGEYVFFKAATLSAGVFNGEGQNVTGNTDSTVLGVTRLVVRPIPVIAFWKSGAAGARLPRRRRKQASPFMASRCRPNRRPMPRRGWRGRGSVGWRSN